MAVDFESLRRNPYYDQFGGFDVLTEKVASAKQVAHAWQLSGVHRIQKLSIDLEGAPRAIDFRKFFQRSLQGFSASHPNLIDSKEAAFLASFIDERADPNDAMKQSSSLLYEEFKKGNPISLSSGFRGHRVIVAFYGGYLLIANKGIATRRPIELYKIDPEKITAAFLQEILNLKDQPLKAYEKWYSALSQTLGATKDALSLCIEQAYPLSSYQEVGNCVWESLQTSVYGLLLLNRLKNPSPKKAELIATSNKVFRCWQEFLQIQSLARFFRAYSLNPSLMESSSLKDIDLHILRGVLRQFWSTKPVSPEFEEKMEKLEAAYFKTLQGPALLRAKVEKQCYLQLRPVPYLLRDVVKAWVPSLAFGVGMLTGQLIITRLFPVPPHVLNQQNKIEALLFCLFSLPSHIKVDRLIRRHFAI